MFVPRTLAFPIDAIAREVIGKDWPLYAHLLDHWREIVGSDFAQTTTPVKISFPKGKSIETCASGQRVDGILHVRIPQGAQMSFSFMVDTIKQRIADSFGYPAIAKLVFEPYYGETPLPPAPPEPIDPAQRAALEASLEGIENNELRESLLNLGESVMHHALEKAE